ncbi:hypothetical protein DFH06DRAFT_1209891 [Mycena polygramma]|nr:hypothetical protein DFH06DRAFT_1209891 [Mycena polygramma]
MHPSLRLENLQQLPLSIRRIASEAANGSVTHLQRLLTILERERRPDLRYSASLPVFFVNLDPAGIPTEAAEIGNENTQRALMAMNSLRLLTNLPPEAGVDLWPRIWPWMHFFHTYRTVHPKVPLEIHILTDLLMFIDRLHKHGRTLDLISRTPGLRNLITRAWKVILLRPVGLKQETRTTALVQLGFFMRECMRWREPDNLQESIDGAGGSLGELADLIVQYLQYFTPVVKSSLSNDDKFCLESIFGLLGNIDDDGGPVTEAMISHGLVGALTTVIHVISILNKPDTTAILSKAFDLLRPKLKFHPWRHTVRDAIVMELLPAIISCGIWGVELIPMTELLLLTLPASMMYFPVVTEIAMSLQDPDTCRRLKHPGFSKSPIFSAWTSFHALAEERISVARYWESDERISQRACDDMKCADVRPKIEFKSCGQCHTMFYCSPSCQKADWHQGCHRVQCLAIRSFNFRHPETLSSRSLSFIRVILHADYQAQKLDILRRQLDFIREHPAEQIMTTVFDYTAGHLRLVVEAMPVEASTAHRYRDVDCATYHARVAQSAGRMALHLVSVQEGPAFTSRMFTLRSNTSVLHDGLRRIAAEIPSSFGGSVELQDLIKSSRSELVEIHC